MNVEKRGSTHVVDAEVGSKKIKLFVSEMNDSLDIAIYGSGFFHADIDNTPEENDNWHDKFKQRIVCPTILRIKVSG